jgi:hypothetical protein
MTTPDCSCGFTQLADEQITDHLLQVFAPEDMTGKDGQVHEETERLRCSCGLVAVTTGELDNHFLAIFTPYDAVGRDGNTHKARAQKLRVP